MKILINIIFLFVLFIASGCTKSVPKCGDANVLSLALDIVREKAKLNIELLAAASSIPTSDEYNLGIYGIRTTSVDSQTGANTCAADLTIKDDNNQVAGKAPMIYKVEKTDDGENFYVTIIDIQNL